MTVLGILKKFFRAHHSERGRRWCEGIAVFALMATGLTYVTHMSIQAQALVLPISAVLIGFSGALMLISKFGSKIGRALVDMTWVGLAAAFAILTLMQFGLPVLAVWQNWKAALILFAVGARFAKSWDDLGDALNA